MLCSGVGFSQYTQFSLASDFSIQRSIREGQKYWAFGQTIISQFNFSPKDAAYVSICFYTNGKFTNNVEATAKSPLTLPQNIAYSSKSTLGFKQVSMGWKHYLVGECDGESKLNVYTVFGLGLLLGVVTNEQSPFIDSSQYNLPVLPGKANFKRLTYDLSLGVEKPIGGDVYFYVEGKIMIPSTDYPSDHLLVNHNAPLTVCLNLGFRILFD